MDASSDARKNDASVGIQNSPNLVPALEVDRSNLQPTADEKDSTTTNAVDLAPGQFSSWIRRSVHTFHKGKHVCFKLAKFIGPGSLITVAYIDPDNYQTAISAGAEFEYKLLFMILLSNIIAIYLQVSQKHRVYDILH